MIQLVQTGAHSYSQQLLTTFRSVDVRVLSYNRAFRASRLPRATYVFADMDRIGFFELELAARLYRQLASAGVRVLNDPARVRERVSLLKTLKGAGVNSFDVTCVDEQTTPPRLPVFLRTKSAHRGTLSDLLHSQADVDRAVEDALERGIPRRELALVEYCAEPIRPGLFRKLSVYRIGDTMVPATFVHETKWSAKRGEKGIADADLYEDEYAAARENRYGEALRCAFTLGHIEYGRADFGLVAGRPQVYEINTNPTIRVIHEHPFPVRLAASRYCAERLAEALTTIDTPHGGPPVNVDDAVLMDQRRRNRWMTYGRWMP